MWMEGGRLSERADGGRYPLLGPDELSDAQRLVYNEVSGPQRADGPFLVVDDDGYLAGPFNSLLYAPEIGYKLQAVGAALRFSGTLTGRTRELMICAVAAELDSDYEWYAHSRVALSVGVSPAELASLYAGETPPGLSPDEYAALGLAAQLLHGNAISAEVHAEALKHYGHSGVTELVVLVGYYRTLAGLLATGNVPAPLDSDQQVNKNNIKGETP